MKIIKKRSLPESINYNGKVYVQSPEMTEKIDDNFNLFTMLKHVVVVEVWPKDSWKNAKPKRYVFIPKGYGEITTSCIRSSGQRSEKQEVVANI
jgi:hypothetical protein